MDATLNVNFISPSPAPNSVVGQTISVWGSLSLSPGGRITKIVPVTVQFGTGGQSLKATMDGLYWHCTGNVSPHAGSGTLVQITANGSVQYIPPGNPPDETEGASGAGSLHVYLGRRTIDGPES